MVRSFLQLLRAICPRSTLSDVWRKVPIDLPLPRLPP